MGQTVVLQPDVLGVIEVEVPADWMTFELTIANVCGEPAEFSMTIADPAPVGESLVVGENIVNATVTTQGWNDVALYYFTAPEAGTYYFSLSADYASGSLYYAEAPIYGMVEEFPLVLELEAGQTVELGVSADVIIGDLIGATEDIVYGLGLIISDTAPATESSATISFADLTYRTEDGGEEYQVFSNEGLVYTQNKGTNTNGVKVDQYNNPIRLYKDHVVTFEYAGMTKLVIEFETASKSFAGFTDAVDALANDDIFWINDGDVVTVVFMTAVDSFTLTLANQVRVLSITAIGQ
jgi:hypothetical protein